MALHQSANARMTAQRGASRTSLKPANKPCVLPQKELASTKAQHFSTVSSVKQGSAALAFLRKKLAGAIIMYSVTGIWNNCQDLSED